METIAERIHASTVPPMLSNMHICMSIAVKELKSAVSGQRLGGSPNRDLYLFNARCRHELDARFKHRRGQQPDECSS